MSGRPTGALADRLIGGRWKSNQGQRLTIGAFLVNGVLAGRLGTPKGGAIWAIWLGVIHPGRGGLLASGWPRVPKIATKQGGSK